jgi:predicted nucleic acid-binding protein
MALVLDASITLAWAFQEVEPTASEARERLRREDAVVPSLWWFEMRNGLVMGERRGLLTERRTARFLRDLSHVTINIDRVPDETVVLTLARHRRLTVYDAAYLELALRHAVALATLDQALASAARAEGVSVIGHSTR